jgi:beta-lactamase superfamily II metal-dependent hydrolase
MDGDHGAILMAACVDGQRIESGLAFTVRCEKDTGDRSMDRIGERHSSQRRKIFRGALALVVAGALALGAGPAPGASAKAGRGTLRIAAIDLEGGAATLFVTPEGKSLLIDTGWPSGIGVPQPQTGVATSAERIVAAASSMGVTKIDYVIVTHYHRDHAGGVGDLLARIPVGTFIDHGPNREPLLEGLAAHRPEPLAERIYPQYLQWIAGHRHVVAKPGDVFRIGSMTVHIVTSDGRIISRPLAGGGKKNPACAGISPMTEDGGSENARSVGSIITFGKVRIAALGDLSWNKEMELACPIDKTGPVDVLIVTQHGSALSSNPASVAALHPVVAVMGNGPVKGGDASTIRTLLNSPGLEGSWRNHFATRSPDLNGPDDFIANLDVKPDQGNAIRLAIDKAGEITVTNDRNGFSKTYHARSR